MEGPMDDYYREESDSAADTDDDDYKDRSRARLTEEEAMAWRAKNFEHFNVLDGEDDIECRICNKFITHSIRSMVQHLNVHHGEEKKKKPTAICHLCGGYFSGDYLRQHIKTHFNKEPESLKA